MHITDWMEKVDLRKEIQEVYLHTFLFKLGVKLVGIFIPFYILELGLGIQTVFLFYFCYYGTYIFVSWANSWASSKIGYKHTMLLASPFLLAFYLLLRVVETQTQVIALAIFGGIFYNLYWMGMNPELGKSSHKEKREEDTGYFFSMPSIASIFSPVVGGMILALSSFNALFLTSALLVSTSFLPFIFTREHYSGMDINFKDFLSDYNYKDFLTFYFKGFNSIGKKMLWPAYLALIIGGSLNIGGAGGFRALGAAVTSIFIGKLTNSDNRKKVIGGGVSIAAISYILMGFLTTPLTAFFVSLVNGLSYTAASVPIYSKALDHAEEEDLIEYFAVREVALGLGRVTMAVISLGAFILFEGFSRFLIAFSVVALSVLITGYNGSKM